MCKVWLHTCIAALCAIVSARPGSSSPANPRRAPLVEPNTYTFELRIGAGSLGDKDYYLSNGEKPVLGLDVGYFVRPQLALMYDFGVFYYYEGHFDSEDSVGIIGTHAAAAQFWVASHFWLKGGFGVAHHYDRLDENVTSNYGPAVFAAIGFDLLSNQTTGFVSFRADALHFGSSAEISGTHLLSVLLGVRFR